MMALGSALVLLLPSTLITATTAFAPSHRTRIHTQTDHHVLHSKQSYNDDAFGFIFLAGSATAQDPIFGSTFLILSTIAAVLTNLEKLPAGKAVPAGVAGATLLITPVVSSVMPEELFGTSLGGGENARLIELGFCSVSMVYGLVLGREENVDGG